MDWPQRLTPARVFAFGGVFAAILVAAGQDASAQVRTKKPDRSVYHPPELADEPVESVSRPGQPQRSAAATPTKRPQRELVDVELDEYRRSSAASAVPADSAPRRDAPLQPVGQRDEVLLAEPEVQQVGHQTVIHGEPPWDHGGEVIWDEAPVMHDGTCDGCPQCFADCDAYGCDDGGCDSIGCCGRPRSARWTNSTLCFSRDRWFGSAELLLMFRNGDRLPTLVTTGPSTNADTAGEIGQAGTRVLVGGNKVFDEISAGGRLTLGTWLDDQCCRSLVMRGWIADEETYSFNADQSTIPVIIRPFFNVSDNQTAAQDTQIVAFPNRANGSIDVRASSDVLGADVSVRQLWCGGYGGSVDVLYGYQFMRMDEDLRISSTSTSLDDSFAPLGSILSISDSFDAENEFHGGQFGIASRYREGCWSFHSLLKVGFGSLRRSAKLDGSTFTSIDGANAVDPNGLLIRGTNSGTTTDHTFGWVPELDLSLGWQRYRNFDVTVGYHLIAMTDALRVTDTVDPNLAVNLDNPPSGQQRPALALRYDTFYVQGIHFGLQYVY